MTKLDALFPQPAMYADWRQWAEALISALDANQSTLVELVAFEKANLPDASKNKLAVIYVTDEVGGAQPAYSDGVNWRRVSNGAIVS